MNDKLFSLVLNPADKKRFFIRVRLWSAKGKARDKLKATIVQLDGYVYQNDTTLDDLYEWWRKLRCSARANTALLWTSR